MDPTIPPTPPSGPPPSGPPPSGPPPDPFAQYDPTGSSAPTPVWPKILGIIGAFVVLSALLVGGVFLFTQGGGDDSGDEDSSDSNSAAPADTDESDDFSDFSEDFSDDVSDEPGGEPSDTAVDDTVPPTTVPVEADYLNGDTQPLIDIFTEAVGPQADVVEVLVYEDYGFVTIRDPDRANRVLEYTYINGELSEPESDEPFPGTNLDTETFHLDDVAWDRLPLLSSRAPAEAGFPDGHVTHVIVDSDQPFSSRFLMRIYVTTADEVESDYVVATLDGRFTTR